jgi:hypothetical protein
LLRDSRSNAGVLADCVIDAFGGGWQTNEGKVVALRLSELANLIFQTLTKK